MVKRFPKALTIESLGPLAQLGERYNGIVEVKGSSPLRSTSTLPLEGFFVWH